MAKNAKLLGYAGRILFVDLTAKTFRDHPWTDADYERCLGGKIMAADILYKHIKPGMKAFDEDNWLVVTTGPLTGTGCPNSSRFNISTVSPLTGILTSSNCGGDFGLYLKRAGFDALIISGRAEKPTRIHITDNNVEFIDADDLWGMKVTEAQEALPHNTGKMVIGPAGENKVLYACVFSNERTAGRGGVGAVFGDKMLKAVTAFGTRKIQVADREKLNELNKKWVHILKNHPLTGRQLPALGTAGLIAPMQAHSILATKNFTYGKFDGFEKISGEELAEKYLIRNAACTSCVIHCARVVEVDGKAVKGPELEVLGLLGANIMNDSLENIIRWNYELDEYGMDTISFAGSVAFAMELHEKGLWDSGLKFGKTENITHIIEETAMRHGIGAFLADGTRKMSERFGGEEFAIHAKGMELAAYEPRGAVGHGLGYATSNRGGCHLNAGYLVVVEGLGLDVDPLTPSGKAALAVMFQDLMESVSAAGCCLFTSYAILPGFLIDKPNWWLTRAVLTAFPHVGPVINILTKHPGIAQLQLPLIPHTYAITHATGSKCTVAKFLQWGVYGYNLERVINIILGQKANADTLPKKLTDVEQKPGLPKTKVPLGVMRDQYYKARGWENGIPTRKQLKHCKIDPPKKAWYPYK